MGTTRRQWLTAVSVGGTGLILSGCANRNKEQSGEQSGKQPSEGDDGKKGGGKLGAGSADALAKALETFVLMYENHAAREDTIIFPAWKQTLTAEQLDEVGEKFEDVEEQQFGSDGYNDAVKQIGDIEGLLGLADISQFTAPPPPKVAGP
jgi:hypothetical protein